MSEPVQELPRLGEARPGYRSGFVAVTGSPNVGKSTLVNALVGRDASIVSDKPQTTRHRIRCISTTLERQIVFVDTPGWLEEKRALDRAMRREIRMGLEGVDLVVLVMDATRPGFDRARALTGTGDDGSRKGPPLVVVVSKLDLAGKHQVIPILDRVVRELAPAEVVPVSGTTRENLAELDRILTARLPEGPVLYPPEMTVDRPIGFLVAEFLREQLFKTLEQEVPFATAVEIERLEEADDTLEVSAVILVERDSQKGIVLGKKGARLSEVRRLATSRILAYTGFARLELELFVKVAEGWRDREGRVRELGIGIE